MKKSKIILAIMAINQLVFAIHLLAKDPDSVPQYFLQAKEQLNDMLSGKTELSFERAVFITENAYWENNVSDSVFNSVITFHIENIKFLIKAYRAEQKFTATLFETEQQQKEKYEKALTNWAIFSYMTEVNMFVYEKKSYLHLPFKYSETDPLGTINWKNTQVFNLSDNHIGNCLALVSMFKIFSERLHSEANIATAPNHIYIRHADDKGILYNVELATSSFPGTGTLETLTYTTDEATQNNISLRSLNLKQSVALYLVYLAKGYESKFNKKGDEFSLQCAELALKYDSLNLNAMLLKTEVLEKRVMSKNKTITQLQKDQTFKKYEGELKKLFLLGYREMPLEMKNRILSKLRNDSTPFFMENHTPKPFADEKMETRYASLSWGQYDEMPKTKVFEQYGRTIFNTKTKTIEKFAPKDTIYDNYAFDPVLFAWQIDPLAHKYPTLSPYVFCYDNPINVYDPDGREGIVVSGQPGDHKNKEHFLVNGLNRARALNKQYAKEGKGEKTTWFIYSGGGEGSYDEKTIEKYKALAAKHGVTVQVVSDADDIVEYVNEKTGGDSRSSDKVSNFVYLGHATPGDLDVGFENHNDWNMLTNDKIEPSDFDSDAFETGCITNVVGGCRTAVEGELPGEKSVVDQFVEKVDANSTVKGSDVKVYYPGGVVSDEQLVAPNNGTIIEKKGTKTE